MGSKTQPGAGWGSAAAEDMFRVATMLAGFDARELMLEIHRRTAHSRAEKVNEPTVLAAMQTLIETFDLSPVRQSLEG